MRNVSSEKNGSKRTFRRMVYCERSKIGLTSGLRGLGRTQLVIIQRT